MAQITRAASLLLLGFATAFSYSGVAAEVRGPAFTLDHVTQNRSIGMVVLSPDKSSVVYSHVGRYFGHPVLPTYGEDNNLFLLTLASGSSRATHDGHRDEGVPGVLTGRTFRQL